MILEQVESVRRRPQGPEAARLLQNHLDDSLKKGKENDERKKIRFDRIAYAVQLSARPVDSVPAH